mmetsp:Transcript_20393/g.68446  ORF Transcript_20393/g.68446 Transcript_20393/m.68446 type:complete len:528 (-) Transcript_20393:1170-2753(-)
MAIVLGWLAISLAVVQRTRPGGPQRPTARAERPAPRPSSVEHVQGLLARLAAHWAAARGGLHPPGARVAQHLVPAREHEHRAVRLPADNAQAPAAHLVHLRYQLVEQGRARPRPWARIGRRGRGARVGVARLRVRAVPEGEHVLRARQEVRPARVQALLGQLLPHRVRVPLPGAALLGVGRAPLGRERLGARSAQLLSHAGELLLESLCAGCGGGLHVHGSHLVAGHLPHGGLHLAAQRGHLRALALLAPRSGRLGIRSARRERSLARGPLRGEGSGGGGAGVHIHPLLANPAAAQFPRFRRSLAIAVGSRLVCWFCGAAGDRARSTQRGGERGREGAPERAYGLRAGAAHGGDHLRREGRLGAVAAIAARAPALPSAPVCGAPSAERAQRHCHSTGCPLGRPLGALGRIQAGDEGGLQGVRRALVWALPCPTWRVDDVHEVHAEAAGETRGAHERGRAARNRAMSRAERGPRDSRSGLLRGRPSRVHGTQAPLQRVQGGHPPAPLQGAQEQGAHHHRLRAQAGGQV